MVDNPPKQTCSAGEDPDLESDPEALVCGMLPEGFVPINLKKCCGVP